MPRLVIRDQAALLIGEDAALALEAEHHLVLGVLQVLLVDVGFVAAVGEQRRPLSDVLGAPARPAPPPPRPGVEGSPRPAREPARVSPAAPVPPPWSLGVHPP